MNFFTIASLGFFSLGCLAHDISDKELLKLAKQYNKSLPRKYGNLIVEKVSYLPKSRVFSTTHKLLDKDMAKISSDTITIYQHMGRDSFIKQLCRAKISPKSRALLLKKENVTLRYQYIDRNNKPMYSFSISKQDCDSSRSQS